MTADIQLTASIDFTGAKRQVDQFVAETERKVRKLSDIQAKANAPGGSLHRPGKGKGGGSTSTPSRTPALDIYRQALANERALEAAKNRTLGMELRIQRQLGGNAELYQRTTRALDAYTSAIRTHGTRTMEGVRAYGAFQREMTRVNSEIAKTGGLLPTLNRGFGGTIGAVNALAAGFGAMGGQVGNASARFASVTAAAGTSTRAIAAFVVTAGALATVPLAVGALAVGIVAAGAAMANVTDRFNLLVGKLNAASGSMSSANALFAETFSIAQRIGVAVDDVGTAMGRFAGVGKDIGLTNTETSRLVETFLKLGRVSGQTAQEAASSLTQLTQALASGRLQGDEYRALSEAMPTLTREIAKAMGVTTGELKKVASEGVITADIVLRALSSMTDKVNADFATIPETVQQINAKVGNEFDLLLANLDKRLHLSDLYKFFLRLPLMALEGANKLVGDKPAPERAKDLQGQIADVDGKIARTPFEWARKGLRTQRAELLKELDGINADILRQQVDAGQATIDAENRAWEQRVDAAKRSAQELRAANDPVFKAHEEYRKSVEKLNLSKPFLSKEDYQAAFDAITDTRDKAIERAEKQANRLSVEERAVWNVTESYSALRLELNNARLATEALQSGDFTIIDMKANDRVVDFLINFAKQANVVGKSLDELAGMAGVSLKDLRDGFRGIEVELAKQNALKRSKDLATETRETERLASATLQGADATREVTKAIEIERQLRALGLDAKDKDLEKIRDEIKLKLEAAEAAKSYNEAAEFSRRLVEEMATPAEKTAMRLAELQRNYAELLKSGQPIPEEVARAYRRAEFEAKSSTDIMYQTFKGFASDIGDTLKESCDHFPEDIHDVEAMKLELVECLN